MTWRLVAYYGCKIPCPGVLQCNMNEFSGGFLCSEQNHQTHTLRMVVGMGLMAAACMRK